MHVRLRGRVIRCKDCRFFDPGCHSDVVDGISVTHIDIDPWCRLPGMRVAESTLIFGPMARAVVSRLAEMTVPVMMGGKDRRLT